MYAAGLREAVSRTDWCGGTGSEGSCVQRARSSGYMRTKTPPFQAGPCRLALSRTYTNYPAKGVVVVVVVVHVRMLLISSAYGQIAFMATDICG